MADEEEHTGPEATSGVDGGPAPEHDGAASVIGWANGSVTQGLNSLANSINLIGGLDGRPGAGLDALLLVSAPAGSASDVANPEGPGARAGAVEMAAAFVGDDASRFVLPLAASASEPRERTWGDVLQVALHPDWEAVDGELLQFLARLGGLADAHDGHAEGPPWLFLMGAAAALILGQRAAQPSPIVPSTDRGGAVGARPLHRAGRALALGPTMTDPTDRRGWAMRAGT